MCRTHEAAGRTIEHGKAVSQSLNFWSGARDDQTREVPCSSRIPDSRVSCRPPSRAKQGSLKKTAREHAEQAHPPSALPVVRQVEPIPPATSPSPPPPAASVHAPGVGVPTPPGSSPVTRCADPSSIAGSTEPTPPPQQQHPNHYDKFGQKLAPPARPASYRLLLSRLRRARTYAGRGKPACPPRPAPGTCEEKKRHGVSHGACPDVERPPAARCAPTRRAPLRGHARAHMLFGGPAGPGNIWPGAACGRAGGGLGLAAAT
jgi:hypothetical protein